MTAFGRRALWTLAVGLASLAASGCLAVTVNVTFPQEKIDKAAASIEDLVHGDTEGGEPAPPPAKKDDTKGSLLPAATGWLASLAPAPAEAQIPDLKVRTPEVTAVIESRRQRLPEIRRWKSAHCVGENALGLLAERPGVGCRPEVGALIAAENRDRMTLYRILLQQNNMPAGDLARVQEGFAKVHRERATPGDWIESQGGQWTRK